MEVEAGGAGAVGRLPEFLGAVLGGDRRALFTSEDDGVRLRADVAGQMLIEEVGQLGRDGDSAPAGVGPGGAEHPALPDDDLGLLLDGDGPVD